MITSKYTFTCDCCDKIMESKLNGLPEYWTKGQIVIAQGLANSPHFHLCSDCWNKPIRRNDGSWKITFKKLLLKCKFGF